MDRSTCSSRPSTIIRLSLPPTRQLLMMVWRTRLSGWKNKSMEVEVLDLGLIDYEAAWKLQDQYAAEIAEGMRLPTLLLLEHPHVYTFGRRGKPENLLWGESQLREKGVAIHWVDRGGDVTYHGPGQLVGYPLIPLTPLRSTLVGPPSMQGIGDGQGRIPDADY